MTKTQKKDIYNKWRRRGKCMDCGCEIDYRSKRCVTCRSLSDNPFKGKIHTDETKKLIGKGSSEKFTDDYTERVYKSKRRGKSKKAINGYTLIKSYDHPDKNKQNDVLEHRLIMEKKIGRRLTKDEVVHHINFIRNDNAEENLHLYKNRSEHLRATKSLNKLVDTLLTKEIIIFKEGIYKMKMEKIVQVGGNNE